MFELSISTVENICIMYMYMYMYIGEKNLNYFTDLFERI